jgi:hypothetical protein
MELPLSLLVIYVGSESNVQETIGLIEPCILGVALAVIEVLA